MTFQCQYCSRVYQKESTLVSHSCEQKRRALQQREIGVQWGFAAYNKFFELTQSGRSRSYEEFAKSSYYTAFVKFGRYCHSVHCMNHIAYTMWLLKKGIKLDKWASDQYYNDWMIEYLRKENVSNALERSLQNIVNIVEELPDLRNGYRDYFRLVNENKICYHITTGRISPWILYHSTSGQDFLSRLNEDQIASILSYIDPDYWNRLFKDLDKDVAFVKQVLSSAQL